MAFRIKAGGERVKMMASGLAANAAETVGNLLTGKPILVPREEYDRRLAICKKNTCKKFNGYRCTGCGCFNVLKNRLNNKNAECPDGLWKESNEL